MKMPKINTSKVATSLVITCIGLVSTMVAIRWEHSCTRRTMKLEQELWKERYAMENLSND